MHLRNHYMQIDNERLRTALSDAVAYLRLLPRVPTTSAKIAEIEKTLKQPSAAGSIEVEKQWKIERFTPDGKAVRWRFADGSLSFESEAALHEGALCSVELTVAQLDALIDALAARRQNIA